MQGVTGVTGRGRPNSMELVAAAPNINANDGFHFISKLKTLEAFLNILYGAMSNNCWNGALLVSRFDMI